MVTVKSKSFFFYFVSVFGGNRSLLRYFKQFYISLRSLGNLIVWVVQRELHSANERWVKRMRVYEGLLKYQNQISVFLHERCFNKLFEDPVENCSVFVVIILVKY